MLIIDYQCYVFLRKQFFEHLFYCGALHNFYVIPTFVEAFGVVFRNENALEADLLSFGNS